MQNLAAGLLSGMLWVKLTGNVSTFAQLLGYGKARRNDPFWEPDNILRINELCRTNLAPRLGARKSGPTIDIGGLKVQVRGQMAEFGKVVKSFKTQDFHWKKFCRCTSRNQGGEKRNSHGNE